jgi:hypothetical protein
MSMNGVWRTIWRNWRTQSYLPHPHEGHNPFSYTGGISSGPSAPTAGMLPGPGDRRTEPCPQCVEASLGAVPL